MILCWPGAGCQFLPIPESQLCADQGREAQELSTWSILSEGIHIPHISLSGAHQGHRAGTPRKPHGGTEALLCPGESWDPGARPEGFPTAAPEACVLPGHRVSGPASAAQSWHGQPRVWSFLPSSQGPGGLSWALRPTWGSTTHLPQHRPHGRHAHLRGPKRPSAETRAERQANEMIFPANGSDLPSSKVSSN